jgi:hypothetical protein
MKKRGPVSALLQGKRLGFLIPQPSAFFQRLKVERAVFASVLFLALDPAFISRTAEGPELDSDRIELIEQRRGTDPTLYHIAMALRAGIQSGDALDRMYGEDYQHRKTSLEHLFGGHWLI